MTAWVLIVSSLETGQRLGMGLLCLEAQYAAIGWHGVGQLDHLHATPQHWTEIGDEIGRNLEGHGLLPHDEPIGRLFCTGHPDIYVRWWYGVPAPTGEPAAVLAMLDKELRSLKTVSEFPPRPEELA